MIKELKSIDDIHTIVYHLYKIKPTHNNNKKKRRRGQSLKIDTNVNIPGLNLIISIATCCVMLTDVLHVFMEKSEYMEIWRNMIKYRLKNIIRMIKLRKIVIHRQKKRNITEL